MADHFELANYSVRESASTTLTIADFMNNFGRVSDVFSTSNSANQFYVEIYPRGYRDINKEFVFAYLRVDKSDRQQASVYYNVSILDVNGENQRTRGDSFFVVIAII